MIAATALLALASCSSDSKSADTTEAAAETTDAPATTVAETDAPTTTEATDATTAETTETTEDTTAETTTDETTEDTTEDTTAETTTDETTDDTSVDLETVLQELLLTPEEVGPTFVEDTYTAGDGTTPCGINVEGQFPPIAKVGVQIANADPAVAMIEEIHVYNSDAEAEGAFNLASTAFGCGTVDGITFGDLLDVTDEFGLPSYLIPVTSADFEGVLFLVLESDAVVVLQFQQEVGVDVSSVPDPATVTQAAIDKIESLLNS